MIELSTRAFRHEVAEQLQELLKNNELTALILNDFGKEYQKGDVLNIIDAKYSSDATPYLITHVSRNQLTDHWVMACITRMVASPVGDVGDTVSSTTKDNLLMEENDDG